MSQEYIEISERTVSEAITAACQKLAVPSERIEYEVIDPGKAGFLGIGARAAKIRARVKKGMEDSADFDTSAIINDVLSGKDQQKKAPEKNKKGASREERKENRKNASGSAANAKAEAKTEAGRNADKKPAAGPAKKEAAEEIVKIEPAAAEEAVKPGKEGIESLKAGEAGSSRKESAGRHSERGSRDRNRGHRRQRRPEREDREVRREQEKEAAPAPKKRSEVPVLTDEQIEEVKERARTFLTDVFQAMDLDAEISSTYEKETGMLTIDMKGENMGMLIGKRGQTLDSLQYLVSLVVNKGIDGYIHVKADTENYRERRKKTLENLAKNIASKVKRNHTSVALEPMNPYERRIIHSALQGDRYVTTYSEGEEPYRKVIVTMKEDR